MIKNKFLLYLLCGVMFSPALALGECKPTQDCRALGYKEAPCPEQGVKCPFGETWYCPLRCADGQVWKDGKCTDVLGSCSGAAKNCKIGDILNSDGTCTTDKVSGKAPIGVVIYISSEGCGTAVALEDVRNVWDGGYGIKWGDARTNIPDLWDCNNPQGVETDFDSCGNTQKIVKTEISDPKLAAKLAVRYAPSSASATRGKWCLPAGGVVRSIKTNCNRINSALSKAEGKLLQSSYWSSNEVTTYYAWSWDCDGGRLSDGSKESTNNYVRPVIEF